MYKLLGKRILDILASSFFIILLLPIMAIIGILIFILDLGNPFFIQKRVGYQCKDITIIKFRSMPVNTENLPSSNASKLRVTPIGNIIRRTNLDELPQLFNIFLGDISLVGPRPCLKSQIELIELRKNQGVYTVKPGLTGLAQINSYDDMPDQIKADWDAKYAKGINFMTDMKIILSTFVYLTKKPPVY